MDKTTPFGYSNNSNWITDSENECEDDPIISLDDNGLPCENLQSINKNYNEKHEEEDSFAGEFYKCGTDWSCLSSSSSNTTSSSISINASRNDPDKKRLKQSNLFELWKLPSKTNVEASTSLVSYKKMKKSVDDFPTQRDQKQKQKQQPRACPFYKKMPGNYVLVEL